MSLILASGSPRRRELMALITPNYTVAPSDVDESRITAATPAQLAQALAEGKPVVALESTIISHGMPYPQNLDFGRKVEQIIREAAP